MQNNASKSKRIRFAVLEIALLIVLYCTLAFIRSLADDGQISCYPDCILAQNIAVFVWVIIAAPLAIFELRKQHREDPAPSLSCKEARAKIVKLAIAMVTVFCAICALALALQRLGLFFGSVDDVRDFALRALVALLAIFTVDVVDVRRSTL